MKIKTYTILKGCHYSNFIPCLKFIDDEMKFQSIYSFDKSCAYSISEKSCVNKLFGFCFGFGVHEDSVRFGWTYNEDIDKIVIWKYIYDKGILHKHNLCNISLNTEHTFTIKLRRAGAAENYRFMYVVDLYIDGYLYDVHTLSSNKLILTTLGPYFGGNTRAPHKMKIFKVQ